VHVTHFNDLMWDAGKTRTTVIEHGVVDPGYRYTGKQPRIALAINEPIMRARVTGADLLDRFALVAPIDVFGMAVSDLPSALGISQERLATFEDLPQHEMHEEIARRRAYLHTTRWTSLGLSLIEAMMLGLPVVALATTEAPMAVPPNAGVVSTSPYQLCAALRLYLQDLDAAREAGGAGRTAALARFGVERFLADWEELLNEVTS
jgi:glycosyltransferase involved in cell wall biosynthesis